MTAITITYLLYVKLSTAQPGASKYLRERMEAIKEAAWVVREITANGHTKR